MNRDFAEMLSALSEAGVEFLVVGAHALAAHSVPRATGDLDIWVNPTLENASRVMSALRAFGAPLHGLTEADLTTPGTVYQIGVAPSRVDILTAISGVRFDEAWQNRLVLDIGGIHRKQTSERPSEGSGRHRGVGVGAALVRKAAGQSTGTSRFSSSSQFCTTVI